MSDMEFAFDSQSGEWGDDRLAARPSLGEGGDVLVAADDSGPRPSHSRSSEYTDKGVGGARAPDMQGRKERTQCWHGEGRRETLPPPQRWEARYKVP